MTSPAEDQSASEQWPQLVTEVPGPASRALAQRLSDVESRNVTFLGPPAPIFWARASGANVWDVDGNRYLDLGGAFGVANVGHSHPEVTRAISRQAGELLHGMGDVHPSGVKVELLEALCARYPGGADARGVLSSSGSDAVETALKTAALATGRAGVLAFDGGYHGLALGALDATHRSDFRDPFAARLPGATHFARFGDLADVRARLAEHDDIGAILVEPIQGRGGERIPPDGFLTGLRALCDERELLLIADEIYTGFGRTGRLFACEHDGVTPDLLCLGKGLSSGMPISACLGRADVMDAWPRSTGEALHTQTFLGHPASCAAGLASLRVLEEEGLAARAKSVGERALDRLASHVAPLDAVTETRGRGLMLGIECVQPETSLTVCQRALEAGLILLPSGDGGRVLSLTPPLCIEADALMQAIDLLGRLIGESGRRTRAVVTERTAIETTLLEWMSEAQWHADDARFADLALRLFAFQFETNPAYGRFCQTRGRTPDTVHDWRDVPAVPSGAFKELELRCFEAQHTVRTFRTSGTSGEKRGALHLDTLALYEASLRPTLRTLLFGDALQAAPTECAVPYESQPAAARMTLRILAPSPDELPDSSLSYMFGCLLSDLGDAHSGFDVSGGSLRADALARAIEAACADGRTVSLCGTAFAFVHLLDDFAERGLRFTCPPGSRIMETGGFKGRTRELSRNTLYAALHETLGIEPTRIVNQYGMTELGSQFYDSVLVDPAGPRRKWGAPWVRVRLVDPETGRDVHGDEPGLIVIHDLANTGSVAAIQTADLGRWVEGDPSRSADPRFARGFEVLGREPGAEARGCSIAADLMLGDEATDTHLG